MAQVGVLSGSVIMPLSMSFIVDIDRADSDSDDLQCVDDNSDDLQLDDIHIDCVLSIIMLLVVKHMVPLQMCSRFFKTNVDKVAMELTPKESCHLRDWIRNKKSTTFILFFSLLPRITLHSAGEKKCNGVYEAYQIGDWFSFTFQEEGKPFGPSHWYSSWAYEHYIWRKRDDEKDDGEFFIMCKNGDWNIYHREFIYHTMHAWSGLRPAYSGGAGNAIRLCTVPIAYLWDTRIWTPPKEGYRVFDGRLPVPIVELDF